MQPAHAGDSSAPRRGSRGRRSEKPISEGVVVRQEIERLGPSAELAAASPANCSGRADAGPDALDEAGSEAVTGEFRRNPASGAIERVRFDLDADESEEVAQALSLQHGQHHQHYQHHGRANHDVASNSDAAREVSAARARLRAHFADYGQPDADAGEVDESANQPDQFRETGRLGQAGRDDTLTAYPDSAKRDTPRVTAPPEFAGEFDEIHGPNEHLMEFDVDDPLSMEDSTAKRTVVSRGDVVAGTIEVRPRSESSSAIDPVGLPPSIRLTVKDSGPRNVAVAVAVAVADGPPGLPPTTQVSAPEPSGTSQAQAEGWVRNELELGDELDEDLFETTKIKVRRDLGQRRRNYVDLSRPRTGEEQAMPAEPEPDLDLDLDEDSPDASDSSSRRTATYAAMDESSRFQLPGETRGIPQPASDEHLAIRTDELDAVGQVPGKLGVDGEILRPRTPDLGGYASPTAVTSPELESVSIPNLINRRARHETQQLGSQHPPRAWAQSGSTADPSAASHDSIPPGIPGRSGSEIDDEDGVDPMELRVTGRHQAVPMAVEPVDEDDDTGFEAGSTSPPPPPTPSRVASRGLDPSEDPFAEDSVTSARTGIFAADARSADGASQAPSMVRKLPRGRAPEFESPSEASARLAQGALAPQIHYAPDPEAHGRKRMWPWLVLAMACSATFGYWAKDLGVGGELGLDGVRASTASGVSDAKTWAERSAQRIAHVFDIGAGPQPRSSGVAAGDEPGGAQSGDRVIDPQTGRAGVGASSAVVAQADVHPPADDGAPSVGDAGRGTPGAGAGVDHSLVFESVAAHDADSPPTKPEVHGSAEASDRAESLAARSSGKARVTKDVVEVSPRGRARGASDESPPVRRAATRPPEREDLSVERLRVGLASPGTGCQPFSGRFSVARHGQVSLCFRALHPTRDDSLVVIWRRAGETMRRSHFEIPPQEPRKDVRAFLSVGRGDEGHWSVQIVSKGQILASEAFTVGP